MNTCVYCDSIIRTIRIACVECTGIDLCVQCFSLGAELGTHRNTHPYAVIDCGMFAIFDDQWRATEELQLLEGVEQFGIGSWQDASEFVDCRTPDEVKRHYIKYYVDGNLGQLTWKHNPARYKVHDRTCPNDAPLSPSLTTPLPTIKELSPREQSLLGYLPKRDDFEREDDNEAERLVSTLAVTSSAEPDDLENELKLAHIDMYTRRLEERSRKKRVAREYSLVQLFLEQVTEAVPLDDGSPPPIPPTPPSTNETQDSNPALTSPLGIKLKETLRIFGQFHPAREHNELISSLCRERDLTATIKRRLRSPGEAKTKKKVPAKGKAGATGASSPKRSSLTTSSPAFTTTKTYGKKSATKTQPEATITSLSQTKTLSGKKGAIKKMDLGFDIESMPSCRLLSKNEKQLCTEIRLRPSEYLTIKTLILKNRKLKKQKNIENVDRCILRRVTMFMVKSRLLKPQS